MLLQKKVDKADATAQLNAGVTNFKIGLRHVEQSRRDVWQYAEKST